MLMFSSTELPQSKRKNAGNADNAKATCKDSKKEAGGPPSAPVVLQCEMNKQQLDADQGRETRWCSAKSPRKPPHLPPCCTLSARVTCLLVLSSFQVSGWNRIRGQGAH